MKSTFYRLLHGRSILLELDGGRLLMRQRPVGQLLSATIGLIIIGLYIWSIPFEYGLYPLDWFSLMMLLLVIVAVVVHVARLLTQPVWVFDRGQNQLLASGRKKMGLSDVSTVSVREVSYRHRYNVLLEGNGGPVVLWYLLTEAEAMIVAEEIAAFLDVGILLV